MRVFTEDHHLGDLWCLKICSCLETIELIVRYAEGAKIKGFSTVSNPLVDLIVELELLALLTETTAPLLESLEPELDFDDLNRRVSKLLDERDEQLGVRENEMQKAYANKDRSGILELVAICQKNLKTIEENRND